MRHLPYVILISGFPIDLWASALASDQCRHVSSVREERESFSDLIQISYPRVALK